MAITITNISTGDLNFTGGLVVLKGKAKTVDYVVDAAGVTAAVTKGLATVTPSVASLVDSSTGTAGATVADATNAFSQTVLNNNFATIAARLAALEVEVDTRTKFHF